MIWGLVYEYATYPKNFVFQKNIQTKEDLIWHLQKDKIIKKIHSVLFYRWKRHVLDTMYSFPVETRERPSWMSFFKKKDLVCKYSSFYTLMQNSKSLIVYKYDRQFLYGMIWALDRFWFLVENVYSKDIVLVI